jgi:Ca-activated chloride channel homolog
MKQLVFTLPQFAYPLVLFALVVPMLLLISVWSVRWLMPTRRIVLPVDYSRGNSGWVWWVLITMAESIPALLLMLLLIVLAGPQRNGPPREKRSLTNIQFAVDVSGSMLSPFGEGNRYDASMAAIDKFVDFRKGDSFGLTFFGDAFVHWVPLTSDPSAIKCATPFMKPDIAPPAFGGTAIAKALLGCKKELQQRDDGDKMIVLITDGFSYDIVESRDDLIRDLRQSKITVFGIIVGGEPQDEMIDICRKTDGESFRADDPDALPKIFKRIDEMKPAKVTPTIVETVDYFEPFALLALVFVLFGTLVLLGLRYTPW